MDITTDFGSVILGSNPSRCTTILINMFNLPLKVKELALLFHSHNYELFLVGGSVRDLLMNKEPKDYDFTTNVSPETIIELAEEVGIKAVYTNTFGTVTYVFEEEPLLSPLREFQITPYRSESVYSDGRHPDTITWANTVEEDLSRRDFTINAIGYNMATDTLIDPFNGQSDILSRTLSAVGDPDTRFKEDYLRILRLIRFTASLDFVISRETHAAVLPLVAFLKDLSGERIRDEFFKMIESNNPENAMNVLCETGALEVLFPEIFEGVGCDQSRSHIYDVFTHCVKALQNAADNHFPLHVRLAALLHDVGKPRTKRYDPAQKLYTFYGHEVVGAKMSDKILKRLKAPLETHEKVVTLVRYHMFLSDTEKVTHSAARRLVRNVGIELIWDLINIRKCDRKGMGKTEEPIRLRQFEVMIEEVIRDPVSVKQLAINGHHLMNTLSIKPGPRIGWTLLALLEEVIEDPSKNTLEYLLERAGGLARETDQNLRKLGEEGREAKDQKDEEERNIIKKVS